MKILITGTAGFIGFHLAKKLPDNTNDYYDVNPKYARLAELGIGCRTSLAATENRHPEQSEESSVTTCRDSSPFAQNDRKINSHKDLITFVADRAGHDRRYAIDATKLENELGWMADENFDSGIVKTVAWYLNKYGINR